MARRMSVLVIFAMVSLFLASMFIYQAPSRPAGEGWISNTSTSKTKSILPGNKPLRITVTETGGSHDEVIAALVNAWGKVPGAVLTFFQRLSRYGSHDIMRTFDLENPIPEPRAMNDFLGWEDPNQPIPDVLIFTTCEFDTRSYKDNMTMLLEKHDTYIFCVFHHADRWGYEKWKVLEDTLTPWIEKKRIEFLGLSPHTANFIMEQSLSKWAIVKDRGIKPLVRHFVPVFPVQIPRVAVDESNLAFGLQGDFGQERRDYKMVFERLQTFLAPAHPPLPPVVKAITEDAAGLAPVIDHPGAGATDKRQIMTDEEAQTQVETGPRNITLHLVGHGNHPPVPDAVVNNVVFDEGLNYIDFYTILSRCFALLPAFASNHYLDRKASSTVPASLIAGAPLVATQEIVDTYGYLSNDIVWLQQPDETDFDVIGRVLRLSHQERREKLAKVKAHANKIIEKNAELALQWTLEAFKKIGKRVA